MVLPFLGKAPTIDEETYLYIARSSTLLRPYDWTRAWAPFDADGFVFAHPPLHLAWMSLWSPLEGTLPLMRAVVGLPWIVLLAWSVALLAARLCRHPGLAAAAWLASTTVVLGLHDTLMIDLPAAALATFAVAAYREGLEARASTRWHLASGAALGLALVTKYSAVVIVPVLLLHMWRRGWRPSLLVIALGIVVITEGWLWAGYGRFHAWEVWSRRGEIATGAFGDRLVGTLVRLALMPLPLVLLRSNPAAAVIGTAGGMLALAVGRPAGLSAGGAAFLLVLTGLGGMLLARGAVAVRATSMRRRHGDRDDPLLLGAWLLAGAAGVVLLHNYASPRYLLPVAAPVAILLTRSAEQVEWGKALQRAAIAISAVLALTIAVADHRFAAAGAEVGTKVAALPLEGERRFAGEWSFRYALERAGWSPWRADEVLPSGSWVVVADNASPGAVPTDTLEPMRRVVSDDLFPLRVVDVDAGIGLYAETLGALPFGWSDGPLEGATVYRVR